ARLQDRIEPVPFEDVRRIVEEELGIRLSKAFREFDPDPIGSASLGQVHRAVLRDGRPVAVKVQRPAIWDRIREDLEALRELADLVEEHTDVGHRYRPRQILEELRRALLRELDYRQEARHLERLSRNLQEFDRIVVPRPVDDFTTSRVLTMDYVRGRKITSLSPLARIELDGEQLADTLFNAYLSQILVDGFFHADPHPGNVFLTDDGRIALIDLGMVAHLGPELQERLLKLLLAISDGAGEDAATILLEMAELSVGARPQEFRKEVVDLVARSSTSGTEGVQVGSIFLVVNRTAAEHGVLVPSALTMLGKTLLNLDEVGRTLDPAFDPNAAIRRHAASVMQKRMLRKLSPGELFSTALELNEFVQRLPGRLNRMLDTVSANELEFRVHAIDEERLIAGIQKIANRITVGLILAALIVGAAMLVRIETSATILGYPALAMLLFLAAAAGGTALVISIIHGDRPDKH
ncbi:MAG: ABC1 kinase family protein, partial [Longimicrobiales bacterium]